MCYPSSVKEMFSFHTNLEYKSLNYGLDEVQTPIRPRLSNMLERDLFAVFCNSFLGLKELFHENTHMN